MQPFQSDRVSQFFDDIRSVSRERCDIAMTIRQLFFDADSELGEDIKYGGLVFFKGNSLTGGVFLYKEHMSVEFSEGAAFDDPGKVLEGKGKHRRHIKIKARQDVENKQVAHFAGLSVQS